MTLRVSSYGMRRLWWTSGLLVALPMLSSAQVSIVDEGSFTIFEQGARIGRESFTIRRNRAPSGDVLIANATVELGERRLSPALRADTSGAPLAYQVEVKQGVDVVEKLSGQLGRGRFSARVKTPAGESAKEYLVSNGAIVLDDDIFHQYYFVAQGNRSGTVPVVLPRRSTQVMVRVQAAGQEQVVVGGTPVEGQHITLTFPDGERRDVWADTRGRVLKVELERRKTVALRDEPPH